MKLARTGGRGSWRAQRLLESLEHRGAGGSAQAIPVVEEIVRAVRRGGDRALRRYSARFDGLAPRQAFAVDREEMEEARRALSPALRRAMESAAKNIRSFARRQMPKEWSETTGGLTRGQRIRPIASVGCYVPGGRYPLPSTMLMTVIPAQVAGVERIAVASPHPAKETLAAAAMLDIRTFYRIGGAQAVAALAYGTESVPRVDKVVGPGNRFVTAAKRMVSFDCGIDMLAGPTEIVVCSERGDPDGIAADLAAQAEHDPDALAIFVTTREDLARQVVRRVHDRVKGNPIAKQAIAANGVAIVAASAAEAQAIVNRLAPEHLTVDAAEDLDWVRSAGSVFIGKHSPQPMGDYVSGPNHTLPTGGLARQRGGLSVMDYLKVITVQQYTADGLRRLGPQAIALAEAEGLRGHAEAVRARGIDAGNR